MKSLAVLNECAFTPQQKKYLKQNFSDAVFYTDTTTEDEAIKRIGQRNIIMIDQFLFSFSEKLLKMCPNLELIIVNTTAYDAIDITLLNKYHVKLAHVPTYATQDVAEVALGMIFALNNALQTAQKIVTKKHVYDIWPGHPIIPFLKRKQLKNQTVGIIGLGRIGQRCAMLCHALGMNILGFNRSIIKLDNVQIISLKKLLKEADIILITMKYTKGENDHLITKELLTSAKNDAFFLSVSHPNLIDIEYLINNPNKFRGIGFDYLVTPSVRQLMKIRKNNIIVTPHLGSQSIEAIEMMTESMIKSAVSFSTEKPVYLIN